MSNVDEGKLCAILAWIFPIGLIWYFVDEKMKKNKFANFHVKQSLVLAILALAIYVVGSIIPVLGWFIILPLGNLLVFILFLIGIISAINGKEKELPVIGKYGKKFTF